MKDETRKLWERHGTVILEGYGATECSPVVACSLPDRNRHGSVGPFLPGIEWRLEPVEGIHEGGRLSVRGPNVMRGYLDPEAPGGIAPPEDGWHDMGDIVSVDDGMVRILGRAKRFAKVGGEMISLAAIEAVAQGLWPEFNHVVVALPDPRKGEQVVLITDKPDADRDALMTYAREQGFPELWVPKAILVSSIPVLGSGKTDYAAAVEMARRLQADALGRSPSQPRVRACRTACAPHFDIMASRCPETSSRAFMKNSPSSWPCRPCATSAQAQPRPMTPAMACAQAQQLVLRNGAIVLGTGTYTYDRYVRDLSFCQIDESLRSAWVPARDTPQCFVGYVCRSGRDWWDD